MKPKYKRVWILSVVMGLAAGLLAGCGAWQAAKGLERPNGVAVAADGSIYVMDFGNVRIAHLRQDGKLIKSIGKFGTGIDEIYYGWDLAVGPEGNLYFGNVVRTNEGTSHDGVKVFSPKGKFIREVGGTDYTYDNRDETYLPYGVDVDSSGRVYTADYSANGIRIFSPEGQILFNLPGQGGEGYEFTNPGDVVVDDARGLMYVTDFTMGALLQFRIRFQQDGTPDIEFVQVMAEYGRENGQLAFPQNLAVDEKSGSVYVGDMANRRVQAFDSEGAFIAAYAPKEVEDWQVLGITIGPDGRILAADALNNLVWVFAAQDGAGEAPAGEAPGNSDSVHDAIQRLEVLP